MGHGRVSLKQYTRASFSEEFPNEVPLFPVRENDGATFDPRTHKVFIDELVLPWKISLEISLRHLTMVLILRVPRMRRL
jgi:hypothetical protein